LVLPGARHCMILAEFPATYPLMRNEGRYGGNFRSYTWRNRACVQGGEG
jgi:hypothetical protein